MHDDAMSADAVSADRHRHDPPEGDQSGVDLPAHEVADWRIRVFSLYERVRAAPTPREGHDGWRRERDALFGAHPASPLLPGARERFRGLSVAPYDPAYRFEVPLLEEGAGELRPVTTGTDGVVPFVRLGTFEIPGVGRLAAWRHAGYGGGVFVPFRDATAGGSGPEASYGAGRYLIDSIKGAFLGASAPAAADGAPRGSRGPQVIYTLDFNFAYNPSCAYNEAWACPLPGPDNRLEAAVPVGELMPTL
jgi:uncharacterized protein (DUF1684 family)